MYFFKCIIDAFRPGIRYTFNVYGIQDDRSYLLEKKAKYLKELEPTDSLSLNIDKITMNSLTVSWRRYDQEFRAGFIRGYILYMKKNNQSCTAKESKLLIHAGSQVICTYNITKPNQTELTIRHLEPNTKYLLAIKAYTVKSEYNDNDNFTSVYTSADT
ncbi:PREDICTED: oncostatin-M-specific receptor subunit beta [Thamnophis sirtalis]|uniref:Oncostatin-M-specific receptor subunit beta n=1 Tax=Thamnophis sirtalis TaxID=35019 RepID=A0A6I9Y9K8_9SAUR|nr:PREDICTED: oncostatin-M-specific receptor subunit beta [Thamnophis sirtalis]